MAGPDFFESVGNTPLQVAASSDFEDGPSVKVTGSLLANDTPESSAIATTVSTALGGTAVIQEDGSFEYVPALGVTGTQDSFTYTVTLAGETAEGIATISLSGRVWYVDAMAPFGGDGSALAPFNRIAPLSGTSDVDAPGDTIYLFDNPNRDLNINQWDLEPEQKLYGVQSDLIVDGLLLNSATEAESIIKSYEEYGINLSANNEIHGISFFTVFPTTAIVGTGIGDGVWLDNLKGRDSHDFLNIDTVGSNVDIRLTNLDEGQTTVDVVEGDVVFSATGMQDHEVFLETTGSMDLELRQNKSGPGTRSGGFRFSALGGDACHLVAVDGAAAFADISTENGFKTCSGEISNNEFRGGFMLRGFAFSEPAPLVFSQNQILADVVLAGAYQFGLNSLTGNVQDGGSLQIKHSHFNSNVGDFLMGNRSARFEGTGSLTFGSVIGTKQIEFENLDVAIDYLQVSSIHTLRVSLTVSGGQLDGHAWLRLTELDVQLDSIIQVQSKMYPPFFVNLFRVSGRLEVAGNVTGQSGISVLGIPGDSQRLDFIVRGETTITPSEEFAVEGVVIKDPNAFLHFSELNVHNTKGPSLYVAGAGIRVDGGAIQAPEFNSLYESFGFFNQAIVLLRSPGATVRFDSVNAGAGPRSAIELRNFGGVLEIGKENSGQILGGDDSGGIIKDRGDHAVFAHQSSTLRLTNVKIVRSAGAAIFAHQLRFFRLDHATIFDNAAGFNNHSVNLIDSGSKVEVTDSIVKASQTGSELRVLNRGDQEVGLNVRGNVFGGVGNSPAPSVEIVARDQVSFDGSVSANRFQVNDGHQLVIRSNEQSRFNRFAIAVNEFRGFDNAIHLQRLGDSLLQTTISNGTFVGRGDGASGFAVFATQSPSNEVSGGFLEVEVSNARIDRAKGIFVLSSATSNVRMFGNTLRGYSAHAGITVVLEPSGNRSVDLTISGNRLLNPMSTNRFGIRIITGLAVQSSNANVLLKLNNNSVESARDSGFLIRNGDGQVRVNVKSFGGYPLNGETHVGDELEPLLRTLNNLVDTGDEYVVLGEYEVDE